MKKFIFFLLKFAFLVLVSLELVIRGAGLASHTFETEIIDNEFRLKSNSSGIQVKGTYKEIQAHYSINSQGFNSLYDYQNPSNPGKIAIVGDSYIQGTHVDVEYSIGRTIESEGNFKPGVIHEYGISGWNVYNYLNVAKRIHNRYELIYILITDKDLNSMKPSSPKVKSKTVLRKLYDSSHLLRYLNINRGLSKSIKSNRQKKSNENDLKLIRRNSSILSLFPSNVCFVYETPKFTPPDIERTFIQIDHIKSPINWGKLESHWNENGRWNCANAILNHLKKSDTNLLN